MNKKNLIKGGLGVCIFLLLAAIVSPGVIIYDRFSGRGTGGLINFIGGDNQFKWFRNTFSANARITTNDTVVNYVGSSTLNLRALTPEGDLVTLNLKLKPKEVKEYGNGRIYVDNTATGTYYRANAGISCSSPYRCRPINLRTNVKFDSVRFDINNGKINIAGGEGTPINFRVTGMDIRFLN